MEKSGVQCRHTEFEIPGDIQMERSNNQLYVFLEWNYRFLWAQRETIESGPVLDGSWNHGNGKEELQTQTWRTLIFKGQIEKKGLIKGPKVREGGPA